ncbi:hypothetical protein BO83DRAFT_381301 [Aspergillus eucalypticola CBS 122712]|uniref:Uncharacterized protein n=1 Tax=Aspergillus eucalypticola (strain CBS 122712 / IBT 29274) TaxID=1448314 RepID=A0A317UW14_ASPEC|nr:uncharacterized protein BO83DRAFT_381301 [Aspergillus eucalypticola CBS 122712]PWY65845.1 hypothetical protein BO83DRAFT_381301 [Aspergillus eucalypticola CBS 122712]
MPAEEKKLCETRINNCARVGYVVSHEQSGQITRGQVMAVSVECRVTSTLRRWLDFTVGCSLVLQIQLQLQL